MASLCDIIRRYSILVSDLRRVRPSTYPISCANVITYRAQPTLKCMNAPHQLGNVLLLNLLDLFERRLVLLLYLDWSTDCASHSVGDITSRLCWTHRRRRWDAGRASSRTSLCAMRHCPRNDETRRTVEDTSAVEDGCTTTPPDVNRNQIIETHAG